MKPDMILDENILVITRRDGVKEVHSFPTYASAEKRFKFINEAYSWIGTPFVDCADIKGPLGAVDCGMMLVRSTVDTGLLPPFDPRPYSPWHMVHSDEEFFMEWVQDKLKGVEVPKPRIGDVVLWKFGRSFCHGAVIVNKEECVHAFKADGFCTLSPLSTPLLCSYPKGGARPVKYFDLFGG